VRFPGIGRCIDVTHILWQSEENQVKTNRIAAALIVINLVLLVLVFSPLRSAFAQPQIIITKPTTGIQILRQDGESVIRVVDKAGKETLIKPGA
jgi:hypothetical protein